MPTTLSPPTSASSLLADLEDQYRMHPEWAASPWAWVKTVLPAQKGQVGEKLFSQMCVEAGLEVGSRQGPGHDRIVEGRKVEVKLATLMLAADGTRTFAWLQLRPAHDYDDVALLAIAPDHISLWVLPKADVLAHTVGQHGGKDATETRKLELDGTCLPDWLGTNYADRPTELHTRFLDGHS